jgi:hypothetical protein
MDFSQLCYLNIFPKTSFFFTLNHVYLTFFFFFFFFNHQYIKTYLAYLCDHKLVAQLMTRFSFDIFFFFFKNIVTLHLLINQLLQIEENRMTSTIFLKRYDSPPPKYTIFHYHVYVVIKVVP